MMKNLILFEDFVDYKKLDLRADFDMLNKLMFDGKLRPVRLRIMTTKNVVGLMSYDGQSVKDIGISNYYKMERQEYLNVLAHEMIHLWLEQNGVREKDGHGPKFMAKLKELNERFPEFSIKKTENAGDYDVSGERSGEYGALVFDEDGVFSIVVVQPSIVDDSAGLDKFFDDFKKYALHRFRKLTVGVYRSDYPDLQKWKVKRKLSLSNLELYVLRPDQAEAIAKAGVEIRKVHLK